MHDDHPRLLFTPIRPAVIGDQPTELDVLIRVQAPDALPTASASRPALNLALVIDRSGSMDGRPLAEAKQCCLEVVERLSPNDRLALVTYDNQVDVLVPSQLVSDREGFRRVIRSIRSGGNTNLHGGWLAGALEARPHAGNGTLSRVMLLSDGQANQGVTEPDEMARQCAAFAATGVSTSTYGLAHTFNEELMTAMARAGQGEAWYGEAATDLRERYEAELSLLHATCARAVTLRLRPKAGVGLRLLNDYAEAGPLAWRLPNLVYGAESWALVRLSLAGVPDREIALVEASVTYEDLEGKPYELRAPALVLPVVGGGEWPTLPEDELVARRTAELQAARIQERAREAAARGEWDRVAQLLEEVRALAAGNPWIRGVLGELERLASARDAVLFSKEAWYAAASMKRRIAAKGERASTQDAAPLYLKRKSSQGRSGQ